MKKLLSIALLGIFLYNIGGIFLVFKIQQQAIRKEIKKQIKSGLPEAELHKLTITAANYKDLIWHDEKEFTYKGVMYDIVHRKINGPGSITFLCVNDSQETELFATLDRKVDQATDVRHHGKSQLKLIMLTFFENVKDLSVKYTPSISDQTKDHFHQNSFSQKHIFILSPPPDLA